MLHNEVVQVVLVDGESLQVEFGVVDLAGGGSRARVQLALEREEKLAPRGEHVGAVLPDVASWWAEDGTDHEVKALAVVAALEGGLRDHGSTCVDAAEDVARLDVQIAPCEVQQEVVPTIAAPVWKRMQLTLAQGFLFLGLLGVLGILRWESFAQENYVDASFGGVGRQVGVVACNFSKLLYV